MKKQVWLPPVIAIAITACLLVGGLILKDVLSPDIHSGPPHPPPHESPADDKRGEDVPPHAFATANTRGTTPDDAERPRDAMPPVQPDHPDPPPPAGGIIRGKVFHAGTRSPLQGYQVALYGTSSHTVQTDENGEFLFRHVPHELLELEIGNEDAPFHLHYPKIRVTNGEEKHLDIPFDLSCAISGKITATSGDDPLEDITVQLDIHDYHKNAPYYSGKQDIKTDGEGAYGFDGIPPAAVEVAAFGKSYVRHVRKTLRLLPGEHRDHIDFHLHMGGVIRGTVMARTGSPVADAKITLVPGGSMFDMLSRRNLRELMNAFDWEETTSNAEGFFELAGVPPDLSLKVSVRHEEYAPGYSRRTKLDPGQSIALTITLDNGGAISGRILNEEGEGMAGAGVTARPDKTLMQMAGGGHLIGNTANTTSSENGQYRLTGLAGGLFVLDVSMNGYKTVSRKGIEVYAGEETTGIDVTMERGGHVTGIILSRETGEGVEGADITLNKASFMSMEFERYTTTSKENGFFRIDGLKEGPYKLTAKATGYAAHVLDGVQPFTDNLTITLADTGTLSGRVIAGGKPATRFTIRLHEQKGDARMRRLRMNRVVREEGFAPVSGGGFRMENVQPGTYVVEARAHGFASAESAPLEVTSGEVSAISLILKPGGILMGRVVEARTREGIANATIAIGDDPPFPEFMDTGDEDGATTARSDQDGYFVLKDVAEGKVVMTVVHPDFMQTESEVIDLHSGETISGITIALHEGGVLEGHVFDKENNPQVGAMIVVFTPNRDIRKQGVSNEEGFYRIKGLQTGTYMAVKIGGSTQEEYAANRSADAPPWMGMKFKHVTVAEDAATTLDFGEASGVRLYGRVLNQGRPVAGVLVHASQSGGAGMDIRMGTSDQNGNYSIQDLTPGIYNIQIQGENHWDGTASTEITIPPGATEYRYSIELAQGRISGMIFDQATGQPVSGATVLLQSAKHDATSSMAEQMHTSSTMAAHDGRYVFQHLGAGRYTLQVSAQGYGRQIIQDTIALKEGEEKTGMDVYLTAGFAISGMVRNQLGEGLAGARFLVRTAEDGRMLIAWDGRSQVSNRHGAYRLHDLATGQYDITAMVQHYAPRTMTDLAVTGDMENQDFLLTPGGNLVIVVRDQSGQAIEGAQVTLLDTKGNVVPDPDTGGMAFFFGTNLTDSEGNFMRDHVPSGASTIIVHKDGYLSNTATVMIQEEQVASGQVVLTKIGM